MGYQYMVCHPLTRQRLAPPLRLNNPSWTERVNGIDEFSASVARPGSADLRTQLAAGTVPDESALYVISDNGGIPFGGIIKEREIDDATGNITGLKVVGWKSWLYGIFLGPKLDLTGDNLYGWTQVDQFQIARDIVTYAIAGGITDGRPPIVLSSGTTGKLRDLNIKGLDFKYAGELLDTVSQRSGGFEWDIWPYMESDGTPKLRLVLGYPELGGLQSGFVLRKTPNGANFSINGSITESASSRKTRVWTTGANSTDTLPFAVDSDPTIPNSLTLMNERVTSYSTVLDRGTLASHARAEREFLNPTLNLLNIKVLNTILNPEDYYKGDRARLVLKNDWYDLDLPAVRIIERTVKPAENAGITELVLDLSDAQMPDADEGVTTP